MSGAYCVTALRIPAIRMTATSFSALFVGALLLTLLAKLWLAQRHLAHVQAHRDEVPADFRDVIALDAHQKAADYTCAKTRLGRYSALYEALLLLAFTLGGGIQAISEFWHLRAATPIGEGMAVIVSVLLLTSLLETPFSLYRTFGIEARFGFNKMTLGLYLADAAKGLLLGALLGLPLLYAVLWLMERMGGNWWLYVWLVWAGFNLLMLYLYPTFIAPLFNKFQPMPEGELRSRIEALLTRCGFSSSGLFVMDGSRRSAHGNAYFTGFGRAKRIVFFDTLLQRLSPSEVEAVLAHELGHFSRRHVLKRIVLTFALSLLFLWLLAHLMQADWFYAGLGVTPPTDAGQATSTALALLLFLNVLPVFSFLFHPLLSALSRKHEFEADAYAAARTDARDLTAALVKLYQDNAATLTPDPLYSTFYDSHPPAMVRIAHLDSLQET